MNIIVLQIVIFECPCAQVCRLRPPLDDLAERLRREMWHGRDPDPTDPSVVTIDTPAGFSDLFQHN
jgi:hypothetical protein